ncbi:MAG TPA: hypothetical protein DCM08_08060 [Microscillaceae bacterium]|jgi:Kef-type K+ transport system membrane component KefB|nr:hypothetical protein [Microscillaceae bacterium]
MQSLSHHEIIILLLQVSTMLLIGRILAEIVKKFNQPAVVGELLAGILLGPTLFGHYFPELFQTLFPAKGASPLVLHGLTSIAVILLLFIAGLEVELSLIFNQSRRALMTSFMGIVIPFLLGFFATSFFPATFTQNNLLFNLFLGTALSISALPVIARTLMDLGLFKSKLGMLIIASAMMDDFLGWMFFSVILALMNSNSNVATLVFTVMATLSFTFLMLSIGRKLLDKALPYVNNSLSFPGGILAFTITLGFLGAAFTESIGIHAIFGSFIVAVALGDSVHMSSKTKETIHDFVTNIFATLFFVSIGLKVDFIHNFNLQLVLIIMLLSYFGKIIGCGLGAYWGGFSWRKALAVGFGMNARGAMEIILATLALQAGLIDKPIFVALVVMALVTSMTSGYLIKLILPREQEFNNSAKGFIVMGDNALGSLIVKILASFKIPTLMADPTKPRINLSSKADLFIFHGNLLDKKSLEKIDLHRYSTFLAISADDQKNDKACKIFELEFGEENTFKLISARESLTASLALPISENNLFRGTHWQLPHIERKLTRKSAQEPCYLTIASEEELNTFLAHPKHRKSILPLFIKKGRRNLIPVASFNLPIEKGDELIYIDLSPRSVKPKETGTPEILKTSKNT